MIGAGAGPDTATAAKVAAAGRWGFRGLWGLWHGRRWWCGCNSWWRGCRRGGGNETVQFVVKFGHLALEGVDGGGECLHPAIHLVVEICEESFETLRLLGGGGCLHKGPNGVDGVCLRAFLLWGLEDGWGSWKLGFMNPVSHYLFPCYPVLHYRSLYQYFPCLDCYVLRLGKGKTL